MDQRAERGVPASARPRALPVHGLRPPAQRLREPRREPALGRVLDHALAGAPGRGRRGARPRRVRRPRRGVPGEVPRARRRLRRRPAAVTAPRADLRGGARATDGGHAGGLRLHRPRRALRLLPAHEGPERRLPHARGRRGGRARDVHGALRRDAAEHVHGGAQGRRGGLRARVPELRGRLRRRALQRGARRLRLLRLRLARAARGAALRRRQRLRGVAREPADGGP
mmetsp:Transcript_16333/g.49900  ORF Transcript_16333/g.49900 Transcript_16333/m.49900 type:complete len:227 (-) Transcript_16333:358-1038(-)